MIESKIERYLVSEVKKHDGECYKWVSPGNNAVPDRIVLINSQIWFIETKSTIGKLRKLQDYVRKIIMKHTPNYLVISSKEEVDTFIKEVTK